MNNNVNYNANFGQKKKNPIIKILAIIGGIFLAIIIIAIVTVVAVSSSSNKLVCKSDNGSITIMYNDDGITGYSASGYTYDLDGQKEYAEQVGISSYLTEFEEWFKTNANGECTRSE